MTVTTRHPPRLVLVESDGGGRRAVPNGKGGLLPLFSPDGRSLTFTRIRREGEGEEFEGASIWSVDLTMMQSRQLTPWRNGLEYIASSYSPDGSMLLATRLDESLSQDPEVVALRFDGSDPELILDRASFPVFSPDGSQIALSRPVQWTVRRSGGRRVVKEGLDLFVVNEDGSNLQRLSSARRYEEMFPSWDPSGSRIAYIRLRAGSSEAASTGFGGWVMQVNVDGTCLRELISAPHTAFYGPAWQPGPGREASRIAC